MNAARRLGLVSAAAAMLASQPIASVQASEPGTWITRTSPHDVSKTADQLVGAIEKAGAKVFAVVDHQANAAGADMELAPVTLVIFGNPKVGTPIMQADPKAGIDLPVRVLVWNEEGRTRIGALAPDTLAQRYDVGEAADSLDQMGKALDSLMDAAIAE